MVRWFGGGLCCVGLWLFVFASLLCMLGLDNKLVCVCGVFACVRACMCMCVHDISVPLQANKRKPTKKANAMNDQKIHDEQTNNEACK